MRRLWVCVRLFVIPVGGESVSGILYTFSLDQKLFRELNKLNMPIQGPSLSWLQQRGAQGNH